MNNTMQRLKQLEKVKAEMRGEQIPILTVIQCGDIIEKINFVEVGADEIAQAEARQRIDTYPRSDYMPTVIIINYPDNGRD